MVKRVVALFKATNDTMPTAKYSDDGGVTWNTGNVLTAPQTNSVVVSAAYGKVLSDSSPMYVATLMNSYDGYVSTASSSDGVNWSMNTANLGRNIGSMVFNGMYFVLTQNYVNSTQLYFSSNGTSWDSTGIASPGTSDRWSDITTNGANTVVINATGTKIAVSDSSLASWTYYTTSFLGTVTPPTFGQTPPLFGVTAKITFDGSKYIVYTSSNTYHSYDLVTWVLHNGDGALHLTSNGSTIVKATQTEAKYSIDQGQTWFTTGLTASSVYSLYYSGDKFYAVGFSSTSYSTDGITWTNGPTMSFSNLKMFTDDFITSKLPKYVSNSAVSSSTGSRVNLFVKGVIALAYSTTVSTINKFINAVKIVNVSGIASKVAGINWINIWSMVYASAKWIGVKTGTATGVTSTDGISWTTQTLPQSLFWSAIANNGTINAVIAKKSSTAASSTDGISWTERLLPSNQLWTSLSAKTGLFVAVALQSDKAAISTDGITWSEQTLPATKNWTSITNDGTTFVAVSDDGQAITSTDGITWTQHAMSDELHFNSVTWALNQFTAVASGPTNLASTSPDGITWTRAYMPSSQNWTGVGPGVGNPNV